MESWNSKIARFKQKRHFQLIFLGFADEISEGLISHLHPLSMQLASIPSLKQNEISWYPVYMYHLQLKPFDHLRHFETLFGWFWMCILWTHGCIPWLATYSFSWFVWEKRIKSHGFLESCSSSGMCQNHSKPFKTAFWGARWHPFANHFLGFCQNSKPRHPLGPRPSRPTRRPKPRHRPRRRRRRTAAQLKVDMPSLGCRSSECAYRIWNEHPMGLYLYI